MARNQQNQINITSLSLPKVQMSSLSLDDSYTTLEVPDFDYLSPGQRTCMQPACFLPSALHDETPCLLVDQAEITVCPDA